MMGKHFEIWNNFLFEFSDLAHFSNFPPYENCHKGGNFEKWVSFEKFKRKLLQKSNSTYFSIMKMIGKIVRHQKQCHSSSLKFPQSILDTL